MLVTRELRGFLVAGVLAAIVHYAFLVGLVEWFAWGAVAATLVGYVAGGIASYILNRRMTFVSSRAHVQAAWRFAVVAGIGFLLTYTIMHLLVERWGQLYLPAQILTTGVVLVWSFLANKFWTFAGTVAR